jgi:hypothetical protein
MSFQGMKQVPSAIGHKYPLGVKGLTMHPTLASGLGLPHPNRVISTATEEGVSIRREEQCLDSFPMSCERAEFLGGIYVPQLDGGILIPATG